MCGIVGYVGFRPAKSILIDGLRRLEYRGYDSAGIALIEKGQIRSFKKSGPLDVLAAIIEKKNLSGTIGIGHTRWATHGLPVDRNAHPHHSCSKGLTLVHNGIIENYESLKSELKKRGHKFNSETDTEVLVHLIEEHYRKNSLLSSVRKALKRVKGSYALAVISEGEEGIVCARKDSPLLIGLGKEENFIASDAPALLAHTRRAYILEDNELALVLAQGVEVFNSNGARARKRVFHISGEASAVEKGGYDHFMLKEIMEQPKAIADTLSGRINDKKRVDLNELSVSPEKINSFKRIYIVACGTSAHAGWVGRNIWEKMLGINVEVDLASEFRYRNPLVDSRDLVVVISQSGETADTLAALRLAKKKRAYVLSITNVIGSSVAREADDVLYTRAGPEIAVASTKAYTAQLTALYLLGIYFGRITKSLSAKKEREMVEDLLGVSRFAQAIFSNKNLEQIKKYTHKLSKWDNAFFIGRGLDHVAAMEGALKLKEISYIHAEAYPAGELKHGTLALINKHVPVIALSTQSAIREKMVNNIKEVAAREGEIFLITNSRDRGLVNSAKEVFFLPAVSDLFAPILSTIPMQLIAYHAAVKRGCSVDKPRNLAKSVTVE